MSADREPSETLAIEAAQVAPRTRPSSYPEPFLSRMAGRLKRPLGDLFGLKNFGVNHTTLEPSGESSILHRHTLQDEFVYVLEGTPTLVTDRGEFLLGPGMCAGFAAGGIAHQLVNRTGERVVILEVGDRIPGDEGSYPLDDLTATFIDGKWSYHHKDGRPYA